MTSKPNPFELFTPDELDAIIKMVAENNPPTTTDEDDDPVCAICGASGGGDTTRRAILRLGRIENHEPTCLYRIVIERTEGTQAP